MLEKKTALIVDDEEMICLFIAAVLEAQGFRVLQATTPDEAERIWQREGASIDLVLSDYLLPGRSGVEMATSMLRSNPSLKVAFMSGLDEEHFRPCLHLNDVLVMRKPFSCKAVEEMTAKMFGAPLLSETTLAAAA